MSKIIALVGMPGSGKSIASKMFVDAGFSLIRFGQLTIDLVKERGLPLNEENERNIRESIRNDHGMAAYAILNLPKIKQLLVNSKNVVIDGLYSWSEYKVLKSEFLDQLTVVAVYAPPELRYRRLENRQKLVKDDPEQNFRSVPRNKSYARDHAEIERLEKGGPIAMADITISNDTTFENFVSSLKKYIFTLAQ